MTKAKPEGYVFGRPTAYKKEYCQKVIEWMGEGWSIAEICLELMVAKSTIYQWAKDYPDFSNALDQGSNLSEGWWIKTARGALWNKEFNDRLWYRNMANRFGWRDKVDTNINAVVKQEDAIKELS